MKKSLWITAAAMAVGIGMSAHATTNAALGQWSFEQLANGTPIPSRSNPITSPTGYDSWSADTNNGTAYITNAAPTGVGYPISGGPGTQGLYFDGSVTNHFEGLPGRFFTDFLLKPGQLEDSNLIPTDPTIRLAFFFNTSSNFVLLHGNVGGQWETSTFVNVEYPTNAWLRISIEQDYAVKDETTGLDPFKPFFQVYINGTNLVHTNGWIRNTGEFTEAGVGPWFIMKNTGATNMNALVGMGIGMLDDVVTATSIDFGSPAPSEIGVLASTFNSAYGSISPSGYQTITSGTPRIFTVTVATNMCYVTGLTTNGVQVYGNADSSIVSTQWNISYENVLAGGTNFVAMFAAKSGTSGDYLDNYFSIGNGGDYASFSAAAADDKDLDGFSNYQEAVSGTDPTNALSFLTISNISVDGSGNVVVVFEGSGTGMATNYIVYDANNVTGVYNAVTNFIKSAGTKNVSFTPATPKKFYKVVTPDPGL